MNNSSALEEPGFVAEAISELICDNHVEEIFTSPDIANLLSVSVQDKRKKRLILDLRHINLHMFKQKFKYEGLHIIKIIFVQTFYAFFFDLKARYHHVDIFPNHRKYLGEILVRFWHRVCPKFSIHDSSAPFISQNFLNL